MPSFLTSSWDVITTEDSNIDMHKMVIAEVISTSDVDIEGPG